MAKNVVEASKVDPASRMMDIMFKALAIFGKELNSVFEEADNEVLGIGTMGESEVKEMLRSFAGAVQSSAGQRNAAIINKLSPSGNKE
jgi:aspartate aminotransferase-like enzyme